MAAVRTAVAELETEHKLLTQLLYRNHNQHSSTDLFSTLKTVNRNLKLLLPDKLQIVISKLESSVKGATQAKLSATDLNDLFTGNIMTTAAADLVSLCVEKCISGAVCVRRLLGKKVFLPLYSTLLALSARLLRCLTQIHDFLHTQGSTLALQLKHTELTQPRLSKAISEHLSTPQSRFTVAVHNRLHTQVDTLTVPEDSTTSTTSMGTSINKLAGKKRVSTSDNVGISITDLGGSRRLSDARNLSSTSLYSTGSAQYASSGDGGDAFDADDVGDALVSPEANPGGMDDEGFSLPNSSAAVAGAAVPANTSVPIVAPVLLPVETDYDALFAAPSSDGRVVRGDGAGERKKLKKRKLDSTGEPEGVEDSLEKTAGGKKSSSVIKLKKSSSSSVLFVSAPTEGNKPSAEKEKDKVKVKKSKKNEAGKDGNSGGGGKRKKEDDIDDIFGGF